MNSRINYEMIIVLNQKFTDKELKLLSFNYAKKLKKLKATQISVISFGKRNLLYVIKNENKGNYLQINFSIMAQFIGPFSENLKFDQNILRFLIIKKKKQNYKLNYNYN